MVSIISFETAQKAGGDVISAVVFVCACVFCTNRLNAVASYHLSLSRICIAMRRRVHMTFLSQSPMHLATREQSQS